MENTSVVLVSDLNYWHHCRYMIRNIRDIGQYTGKIIVVSPDIEESAVIIEGAELFRCPSQYNKFWHKYFILSKDVFKTDQMLYLDCDCLVQKPLQPLFDESEDAPVYVNFEPFTIEQMFNCTGSKRTPDSETLITEFDARTDSKKPGFNSGIMLFNKRHIEYINETSLLSATVKFININFHCRTGSDQPIFNYYFADKAQNCNEMHFWRDKEAKDSTILHFCHEDAPWNNTNYSEVLKMSYLDYYKKVLEIK